MTFDVVVVGGGPAGSVCAARLAAKGRRVVVLERERHPRFHLGESLLPNGMGALEAIGVLDKVRARFLIKRGARFLDARDASRQARYSFADAFRPHWDHAFEVPRDEFDELLFRHAGECGADVRECWTVTRVLFDQDRATGVEARDPDGALHTLDARFVADATGREALVARTAREAERIPSLDRTAFYTQVRGAWRDVGDREGDIQIVVLGGATDGGLGGDLRRPTGWFWLIPFADGRTSVGAVLSSAWIRDHRDLTGPEALFDAAVSEAPTLGGMLAGATRLFAPRATADFSFRARRLWGPGWLALGDAGGFIDPLFSTGAHLAMNGGLRAADALDEVLSSNDDPTPRFAQWETEMRAGADLFLGAVQGFYEGELAGYLFATPQHPFLLKAITSLLAGDVFDDDARWAREMRTRFPVRQ